MAFCRSQRAHVTHCRSFLNNLKFVDFNCIDATFSIPCTLCILDESK